MSLAVWLLPALLAGAEPLALSLADALALAREQNPAAQRARLALDTVLEQVELQEPRVRPDVTVSVTGDAQAPRLRDPALPNTLVRDNLVARAEIRARQLLYHSGREPLVRRLRAVTEAAAAEFTAALARVDYEVALAWLDFLQAAAGLNLAEEGVRRAEAQLARVKDLVSLDRVAEVDLLHAESGILEAQSAVVEARSGRDLAQANLNRLLGAAQLDREIQPTPLGDLPEPPAVEAAVSTAWASRQELVALAAQASASRAAADLAASAGGPTVALTGVAAAQTATAFTPSGELGLGFEFIWPLSRLDNSPTRQAAEASRGAEQLDLAASELRAGIALEVRRALGAWQVAGAKLELARGKVGHTTEAHRIRLLQYERRRATLLEVDDALLARRRAEYEQIAARYDLHRAAVALALATGQPVTDWVMVVNETLSDPPPAG